MGDDINLPKWFLVIKAIVYDTAIGIKKACKELTLGLLGATSYLNIPVFKAEKLLHTGIYDMFNQVVAGLLIICIVLSCQDITSKFRK